MNAFKEQCIELRKTGHTLPEIVKITGRTKTTVFYHIQHMPLSAEKVATIRKASGAHIRKFALLRKGKSTRPFCSFRGWDKNQVLLVAHLMFDGEIGRGLCYYNNRCDALLERFKRCMKSVYTFPPKVYHNPLTGVSRICYFNVELGAFLRDKSIELLREVPHMSEELKREFVRAFFDDEGCIYFHGVKKRMVRGYQKDMEILRLIHGLLADLGIKSRVVLPNEVVISGRENLSRFRKEINFSKGVRINGNRSNSIWKRPFEKRELLRRAVESFQD